MRRYISFTVLLCLLFHIKSYSQSSDIRTKQIDSLRNELSKKQTDTTMVLVLIEIGDKYLNEDLKKVKTYLDQALLLTRKIKFIKGEMNAMMLQGELYKKQNKFDKAIEVFKQGVALDKDGEQLKARMVLFSRLGIIYYAQSDYNNAFENFNKALRIAEKIDDPRSVSACMANIGVIYDEQGDYVRALKAYLRGLKFAEEHKHQDFKIDNLINISTIYNQQNNTKLAIQYANEALELLNTEIDDDLSKVTCLGNLADFYFKDKQYSKSLEYARRSLKLAKKTDDKLGVVYAYRAIGKVKITAKNLKEGLDYYNQALKISKEIGEKQAAIIVERELAYTYQKLKDFDKALQFARNSVKDAEEIGSARDIKDGYKTLSDIFATNKQVDSSYFYYKKFTVYKDKLFGEKNSWELNNIRIEYDLDKKETEIALLTKDRRLANSKARRQRIIQYFFIAGFVVIFFIAFVQYRNNLQKQRANQLLQNKNDEIYEKNIQINDQNEAITSSINYSKKLPSPTKY